MRIPLLFALFAISVLAQERQELGLLLGAFKPAARELPEGKARFATGMSLLANYGLRVHGQPDSGATLSFETYFGATPQNRILASNPRSTRDAASLFLMPGLRLKLFPSRTIQPYVAAGAGFAVFEHSLLRMDGQPNDAPRTITRAAGNFGGGVDVRVWRWLSLRGEVRDVITGNPAFNVPVRGGAQHSLLAAGGFVLRFR